jgi:superfamily I DNA/RNA helicase/mRNA-degrading endonuclease RelE of RelBE toxin-antitoxin system
MPTELPKPKVAISSDFLKSFSLLPQSQQKKVREFVEKFRANPASPGINYEKIHEASDSNLRSVRIDQAYRGIVLKPEAGNAYLLLWVDHHDEAYRWAQNRVFGINPETGSLQVVDVTVSSPPAQKAATRETRGLFDGFKDRELLKAGIPEALLALVRSLKTESELDDIGKSIPQEAFEALFMLAAGFTLAEVFNEQERQAALKPVDTTDFVAALETPDSQRRFHVVEDAKELAEILNAPLDQWRVFLHPSQRKVVEWNANGPVRVLGGAGTGKTVAAMHRARWLAQNFAVGEHDRILLTTFTKNLAEDILQNLRKICSVDLLRKIEVINLDGWVANFLKRSGYDYKLLFSGATSEQWKSALNQAPESLNDEAFLRDEWEKVIQANAVRSFEDYLRASRIGRGRRLSRVDKKSIWPVFEEYRAQLNVNSLKELVDATRDARSLLERQGDALPYRAVLVDEAQDMGTEAFKLIRQLVPPSRADQRNNLFITGDAHQRIYGQRVVLSHCGIDVRGRSRKLRVNYRTTEETRKWAVRLLEGRSFDDLDGSSDSQKGYYSLLRGESPQIIETVTFADEVKKIIGHIKSLQQSGVDLDNVCLVARTNELVDQYEGAIKSAGIPAYRIHRSIAEDRRNPGLRLATMHRVKGLEFEHVIVAGVNEGIVPLMVTQPSEGEAFEAAETETRERALLYVAVTRAKRSAIITSHGKKSAFLSNS